MPITERNIRKQPPTREELEKLVRLLPGGAKDLISTRSRRFRELQVDLQELNEDQLLDLMAREPAILRRPIITDGNRVVVGFDPDALEQLG